MLDMDLAELYGVETKQLKRSVRRNIRRFPSDFMIELSKEELNNWRSQFGTSNSVKMGLRIPPFAFTEYGILMLASVLNSDIAIQVNIRIVRIFAKLREMITSQDKFVEWIKDDHITVKANENYWRARPKLDKIIFRVIEDPSARLLAIQAGEIHGMEYPDPASFDLIKSDSDLQLLTQSGMNVGYLAMNTGYGYYDENENGVQDSDEDWVETPGYFEPLTNKLVRKAINYAIDKNSIIDNLYKGTAIVAKNGMPPFMLGHNDDIVDYSYDPDMAKDLLEEAGYPNGFNTTLWVMPVSRPYMFDPPKIAEAIQSYLAVVNINVELYQIDWSTYLEETENGNHPMCLLGWTGDNGDPDNFMRVLYGPNAASIGTAGNVAFYNNSLVRDKFTAALQSYDATERAKLYEEAQVLIHEDAPFVYLAHATQNMVFLSNVKGYVLNPTERKFFYPVEIE